MPIAWFWSGVVVQDVLCHLHGFGQERRGGKRAAPWRTRVCCGWREAFVCDSKGNGDGDRHPPCAVKVLTQLGNFGSDGAKYTDTTGRDGNCLRTKAAAQHGTKYTGRI